MEVMIYVRAIREGDFLLYALTKIVPWFFALGHTNYARWISISVTWFFCTTSILASLHSFAKNILLSRKQHTCRRI